MSLEYWVKIYLGLKNQSESINVVDVEKKTGKFDKTFIEEKLTPRVKMIKKNKGQ